jgi:hypothetical protein
VEAPCGRPGRIAPRFLAFVQALDVLAVVAAFLGRPETGSDRNCPRLVYAYSVARVMPRASAACAASGSRKPPACQVDSPINIDKLSRLLKHRDMRDGLEDVVAASTRLSEVDGEAGRLTIAGYAVEDLAPYASFEEMAHLLLHGRLPERAERIRFAHDLAERRTLPRAALEILREAAAAKALPMDALRMAVPILSLGRREDPLDDAMTAMASFPTIAGAYWRMRNGEGRCPFAPISPTRRTTSINSSAPNRRRNGAARWRPISTPSATTG